MSLYSYIIVLLYRCIVLLFLS